VPKRASLSKPTKRRGVIIIPCSGMQGTGGRERHDERREVGPRKYVQKKNWERKAHMKREDLSGVQRVEGWNTPRYLPSLLSPSFTFSQFE